MRKKKPTEKKLRATIFGKKKNKRKEKERDFIIKKTMYHFKKAFINIFFG
jgi:hypothetical protein